MPGRRGNGRFIALPLATNSLCVGHRHCFSSPADRDQTKWAGTILNCLVRSLSLVVIDHLPNEICSLSLVRSIFVCLYLRCVDSNEESQPSTIERVSSFSLICREECKLKKRIKHGGQGPEFSSAQRFSNPNGPLHCYSPAFYHAFAFLFSLHLRYCRSRHLRGGHPDEPAW